jgi:hypothetical protein
MRNAALSVCLLLTLTAAGAAAQTPRELEVEPIVKLQPGETEVAGHCLTQQELDLIARLNALRRPTLGVEGDNEGDDPAPFDPHYFVGSWEVGGVLPDSPLAESSEFVGTETVRHVEGCTYASTIEASTLDGDVTVESILVYDRRIRYLVRLEEDSRGFELLKVGRLGGDPGGYFSHHWEAAPIERQGGRVRLAGRTFMLSPFHYDVRMRMSVDGEPFVNYGTLRWRRLDEP